MDGQPHVFSRDLFTLLAKFFGVYPLEWQFLNNDSRPLKIESEVILYISSVLA